MRLCDLLSGCCQYNPMANHPDYPKYGDARRVDIITAFYDQRFDFNRSTYYDEGFFYDQSTYGLVKSRFEIFASDESLFEGYVKQSRGGYVVKQGRGDVGECPNPECEDPQLVDASASLLRKNEMTVSV